MIKQTVTFFGSLTLVPLLLINNALSDESSVKIAEPEKWYQVELFVFSRNVSDDESSEQWPEELGLRYPEKITVLRPPLTVSNNDFTEEMEGNDSLSSASNDPTLPKAFVELKESAYSLKDVAANIIGQYDYRPLFHKAWRQTIADRNNSLSIAINGGEKFDDHHELEGSINISVERYLHINTDLWLSRFTSNASGKNLSWQLLPAAPQVTQETDARDIFQKTALAISSDNTEIEQAPSFDISSNTSLMVENQLDQLQENQYSVERTVVLRQHRRMRSNELHYIDHPLFGLLVRITPYETAKPEEPPVIKP